jgi:hypothetical protein
MNSATFAMCGLWALSLFPVTSASAQLPPALASARHRTTNTAATVAAGTESPSVLPTDPDLHAVALILPSCTNCLIRLCNVSPTNKLSGYCLEGARGGICHQSYDPTHCPVGKSVLKPGTRQCGYGTFKVDLARPCL